MGRAFAVIVPTGSARSYRAVSLGYHYTRPAVEPGRFPLHYDPPPPPRFTLIEVLLSVAILAFVSLASRRCSSKQSQASSVQAGQRVPGRERASPR